MTADYPNATSPEPEQPPDKVEVKHVRSGQRVKVRNTCWYCGSGMYGDRLPEDSGCEHCDMIAG